jgi:hypothetical protein
MYHQGPTLTTIRLIRSSASLAAFLAIPLTTACSHEGTPPAVATTVAIGPAVTPAPAAPLEPKKTDPQGATVPAARQSRTMTDHQIANAVDRTLVSDAVRHGAGTWTNGRLRGARRTFVDPENGYWGRVRDPCRPSTRAYGEDFAF